jgi:hypothetical protein
MKLKTWMKIVEAFPEEYDLLDAKTNIIGEKVP